MAVRWKDGLAVTGCRSWCEVNGEREQRRYTGKREMYPRNASTPKGLLGPEEQRLGSPRGRKPTRMHEVVRSQAHLRTEQTYVQWVRMFVKWHGLRHPRDMGQLEIEGFPAMLAKERQVAAATHNKRQATIGPEHHAQPQR